MGSEGIDTAERLNLELVIFFDGAFKKASARF